MFFLILGFILAITPQGVRAETMLSPSYKLRFGNFNMTSGTKSSASYSLTDTVGQTIANEFSSLGYTIKAGAQYAYTLENFSFSVSTVDVAFGTLTPNTFSSLTLTLTVNAPNQGYTVTVLESNRLKTNSNISIPDTLCDAGTCTETNAGIWITSTINGFGYNMTGSDVPVDFVNATYFRPFPDISAGENPAVVMSSVEYSHNKTATATYQLSINGSQGAGEYENHITYIATPSY